MGVDVDETGGDQAPFRVDLASAGLVDAAIVDVDDRGDQIARDRDVGDSTRRPGAIDHDAVSDDDVRSHVPPLNVERRTMPRV